MTEAQTDKALPPEPGTCTCPLCSGRIHIQAFADAQAIVDKLPKTADGVPITAFMVLWHPKMVYASGELVALEVGLDGVCEGVVNPAFPNGEVLASDCYSTREAAEAAKDR